MDPVLADVDGGGAGLPWWLTYVTPEVVLILLVALLLIVVIAFIAGWVVTRRVRRSPRWGRQVLVLQAEYSRSGPHREVAQLRLKLHDALTGVQRLVVASADVEPLSGDLPSLARRTQLAGSDLDHQLRLLAAEPDAEVVRVLLPSTRDRVEELGGVATRIRRAALETKAGVAGSDVIQLTTDVDLEVEALQAGVRALQRLSLGNTLGADSTVRDRPPVERRP